MEKKQEKNQETKSDRNRTETLNEMRSYDPLPLFHISFCFLTQADHLHITTIATKIVFKYVYSKRVSARCLKSNKTDQYLPQIENCRTGFFARLYVCFVHVCVPSALFGMPLRVRSL